MRFHDSTAIINEEDLFYQRNERQVVNPTKNQAGLLALPDRFSRNGFQLLVQTHDVGEHIRDLLRS